MSKLVLSLLLFALFQLVACDPDPLQDFCVADLSSPIIVNGFPCKNRSLVTVNDFVFSNLRHAADVNNPIAAGAVFGTVNEYPGLNTLGLSVTRLDLGKGGIIPPHTHPRASEIIYVVHGSLYAGFVSADDKLFAKVIHKGDVMMFPRGLIHFQLNVGKGPALAIVTLNSQFPGFQLIANSMFGSNIRDEVLMKTFFLPKDVVDKLQAAFA